MNESLYPMIFKRKSFHLFRNIGSLNIKEDELRGIEKEFETLEPLIKDIKVKIIIQKNTLNCRRGQEYCILFYSENKERYLENIGYLGEQLDLYLVSKNIGTLWFGIGKVENKKIEGLDFVIMMAISKVDDNSKFRKDMFKSKRKEIEEIWTGKNYLSIANIARFAPSACNTQPWKVIEDENKLTVIRYEKPGKRGIMPKDKINYYNKIDLGIFLCFIELCLNHSLIHFQRTIEMNENDLEEEMIAQYQLS